MCQVINHNYTDKIDKIFDVINKLSGLSRHNTGKGRIMTLNVKT